MANPIIIVKENPPHLCVEIYRNNVNNLERKIVLENFPFTVAGSSGRLQGAGPTQGPQNDEYTLEITEGP